MIVPFNARLVDVSREAERRGFRLTTDDRGYLIYHYNRPYIVPVPSYAALERLHSAPRTVSDHGMVDNLRRHLRLV